MKHWLVTNGIYGNIKQMGMMITEKSPTELSGVKEMSYVLIMIVSFEIGKYGFFNFVFFFQDCFS